MPRKYRVNTYQKIFGKIDFVELQNSSYGEWIIYENGIPKFHVNLFRTNSPSDNRIKIYLDENDSSIEEIISIINLTQNTSLKLVRKPKIKWIRKSELKELILNPIPISLLSNISIGKEIVFPHLKKNQLALVFAELATGHVLIINFDVNMSDGEVYHVFDTMKEAHKFARKKIVAFPTIECCILNSENMAIKYLNLNEEKTFTK